jgi:transcriptional regulator with GAF, ATPase, and Fis domain
MTTGANAFLVVRQDDGYGDVFPLIEGQRFTMGRANTNGVVLKDELCSREHAEVYYADSRWRLRDLRSLNGTRLNGTPLDSEWELAPGDEIHLGQTCLLFVEDMSQLPDIPSEPVSADGLSIKKRLGQTKFFTPLPVNTEAEAETTEVTDKTARVSRHSLTRDLSLLYRLALDMGSASSQDELVRMVLDGLLEAIPADVGAILALGDSKELAVLAYQNRDPDAREYMRVSEFVSNDVLLRREAVLAEDVARDRYLRNRESLTDMGATSVICAPVICGEKLNGLIHLYCTNPLKSLTSEDLEFAVAVAKHLGTATRQLQRQESLSVENRLLRDQLKVESELVGESSAIQKIEEQIGRVAPTNATVLIRGESGSGKELVARAIHYSSHRREGPFICLNCAAITETLLESELFGHEKGSFTGATEKKIGKFEAANAGTIFLDEIGEMKVTTQAKLLRILEGHSFERVGGGTPIRVDVRVVAATNQPLEKAMQEGNFRRDLFYRLQVVEIRVPPLRERMSDIPLLADHFLKRFVQETGRKIRGFTPLALKKMESYDWPGNVREMRNVVERAVALGRGPMLDVGDIWLSSVEANGMSPFLTEESSFRPRSLNDVEREHIEQTLNYTDWNKSQTATILQIERSTLDRKIKAYDLKK